MSIAEAAKATEKLPWKWILLALCLAALTGAAYHTRHQWQGPLSQRVHQMEMHARSQLGDAKAYFQGAHSETAPWVGAQRETGLPPPEVPSRPAASPSTRSYAGSVHHRDALSLRVYGTY